jgi:WhiB family transcriptional regulator, redox-sensing transcriptional regulator
MDPQLAADAWPVLVTLPAEIDIANAHGVCEQIAAALKQGAPVVIADMRATTFCDARGVRALVLAARRAAANGGELRLLMPRRNVARVMKLLGLDQALAIYQNLDGALAPGTGPCGYGHGNLGPGPAVHKLTDRPADGRAGRGPPTVIADREDWWVLAACRSADPDLFFPISDKGPAQLQIARAKVICARCRVRVQCLDFAMRTEQVNGIWGGMTEHERRGMRPRLARQKRFGPASQPGSPESLVPDSQT